MSGQVQVRWVYAAAASGITDRIIFLAGVADTKLVWNGAVMKFPGEAVGGYFLVAGKYKTSIAVDHNGSGP